MQSSERLCAFPMDEDYEPALDSKVADIKQCTLDGEADHILAARFLKRFLENDVPWAACGFVLQPLRRRAGQCGE
jgi:leucyl aminopeptidase